MATEVYCKCNQWQEWSESIFMAQVERIQRTGVKYTGAQWAFCPWCGRHLTKYALDGASAPSAEPDSGLESVPAVESDTQPRP